MEWIQAKLGLSFQGASVESDRIRFESSTAGTEAVLAGQGASHAEHVLDGVAEGLAKEAEQGEVGRHVDAGEEVGERVVEEKVALVHDLRFDGVDHVRYEQWDLNYKV